MLREIADLLAKNSLAVSFSPGVKTALAKEGFSEEFGARELRRLIKRRIEDPLTELILEQNLGPGTRIDVKVKAGKPCLQLAEPAREMVVLRG
jgi:ATP-dependent Clp protease ATP-binding subunit ClpC